MSQPEDAGEEAGLAGQPPTSRLAIASLICGILFIIPPLAVLAIVLGAMALSRVSASGGRLAGRGMAIAGICLGSLLFVTACVMSVLFPDFLRPSLPQPDEAAAAAACRSNLAEIGEAIDEYRQQSEGRFPTDFATLVAARLLDDPATLLCPADASLAADPSYDGQESSYTFARPSQAVALDEIPADLPVAWDSRERHGPGMVNVLYAGGNIEEIPLDRLEELVTRHMALYETAPPLPRKSD